MFARSKWFGKVTKYSCFSHSSLILIKINKKIIVEDGGSRKKGFIAIEDFENILIVIFRSIRLSRIVIKELNVEWTIAIHGFKSNLDCFYNCIL
jgi:hypothetical protein